MKRIETTISEILSEHLGGFPTSWVLIYQGVDQDGSLAEDVVVPEAQLLTHSAGLLRFATVACDRQMVDAHTLP